MKVVIFLVTILAVTASPFDQTDEEIHKIKEKCFDLSDIPVEDRVVYNPENPKLKCFNACTYTGTGMMKDGKIIAEKSVEKIQKFLVNITESHAKEFIKHLNDCADIANRETDECEVAYVMIKCL